MADPLRDLMERGSSLYKLGDCTASAEAYRAARLRAASRRDREAAHEARFWEGCSLHGGGRLREALAAMAPVLSDPDASLREPNVYRVATRYARVLAEIPVSWSRVASAVDAIEAGLAGERAPWRSRVELVRARLFVSAGDWERGHAHAVSATRIREVDPWGCTRTSYLWLQGMLCVFTGRFAEVEQLLDDWRTIESGDPFQECSRAWVRSLLQRRLGHATDALESARSACEHARRARDAASTFCASVQLAQTLLALGRVEEARAYTRQAQAWSRSEVGDQSFVARVLAGDWYLARARACAGLEPFDPDFLAYHARPPGAPLREPMVARAAARDARREYAAATPRARELDARGGRPLRDWQLGLRLRAVEEVEAALGGSLAPPAPPGASHGASPGAAAAAGASLA